MEYVIIGVIVAAALACPVLMCGPMLLRRFGIIKGGSTNMSCMGMKHSASKAQPDMRELVARRDAIDREIASVEASGQRPPVNRTAPQKPGTEVSVRGSTTK